MRPPKRGSGSNTNFLPRIGCRQLQVLSRSPRSSVACNSPIVRCAGRNMDDCPIAKTSHVDCQNFPALFGKISGLLYGQVVAEFPVGWGKARAGLRFEEGSATAVRGVHRD